MQGQPKSVLTAAWTVLHSYETNHCCEPGVVLKEGLLGLMGILSLYMCVQCGVVFTTALIGLILRHGAMSAAGA